MSEQDKELDAVIHIQCSKAEKAYWIQCAGRERLKLAEFILDHLPEVDPEWLRQYNERKSVDK